MTIALTCTPERCSAFALDRKRRSSRQAPSPPSTTCLENFSLPGLLIVTTHFDLLNSSEANSVVSFGRAVVATTVAEVIGCIGCLHAGVEAQPTQSGRRPPWDLLCPGNRENRRHRASLPPNTRFYPSISGRIVDAARERKNREI